jgi:hypothetical protein
MGVDWLPQNVVALILWDLADRIIAYSSRACLRATFTVFSPLSISWIFYGSVFYPVCKCFACLPPYVVFGKCEVGAVGELFDGCGNFLQGFSDTLGP